MVTAPPPRRNGLLALLLLASLTLGGGLAASALNICAVCGKEIQGEIYLMTDKSTGEQKLVCSDCVKLPLCYVCGLPCRDGSVELPDGRHLCGRDAKNAVLNTDEALQICSQINDDLDHLFSRFTVFPTNVDISLIDRLDVQSMLNPEGNDFESPDLLGCIRPTLAGGVKRYKMSLMTGMPSAMLRATCAHEYSHAWVGENVSRERHARLARDTEEGFCELVGYLLMDSQQEETQKKFILRNRYTRGQVELFIDAEKRYGFDQILDWMRYGVTGRLESGHLEAIRDVKPTAPDPIVTESSPSNPGVLVVNHPAPRIDAGPARLKLEGIMWGARPLAIINGRTFEVHDTGNVKVGTTNLTIRCLAIQPQGVRIQETGSGAEQELQLPAN